MERNDLIRHDLPLAHGEEGFDRASVGAHLAAVAAHVAALEARIAALEVERDALRRRLEAAESSVRSSGKHPASFVPGGEPPRPGAQIHVFPGDGHRAAARFGAVERRDPANPEAPPATPGDPATAAGEPADDGDEVAARLAISSMALEGADRETIRRKLGSDFDLADPDALLDDVLARLA